MMSDKEQIEKLKDQVKRQGKRLGKQHRVNEKLQKRLRDMQAAALGSAIVFYALMELMDFDLFIQKLHENSDDPQCAQLIKALAC